MFSEIAILILISFVVTLLYKKWFRLVYLSRKIDGFPGYLPILGNALLFRGKTPHEVVKESMKYFQQSTKNLKLWIGPELLIFLQCLEDIEVILSSSKLIQKGNPYKILHPWLREGLLTSSGKKWLKRRKIITPAFHFKILERFVPIFDHHSNILVDAISQHTNFNEVDLYKFVSLTTLDIICESAMGVSTNAQSNYDSEYVKAVKILSKVLHVRMFDIFYKYNLTYIFTKLARKEAKALSVIHNFTQGIIKSRRQELQNAKENELLDKDENDVGSKKKMAFLDILLQSQIDGKPLSDLDIQEEVDTFMFEGHDTTSAAITFCLYNLGCNPEAQRLCFEEIYSIFGNNINKSATYEDLCNLHYMELCIKETLRLFPSVPIISRKIEKDLKINNTIYPAGANICIMFLALGMKSEIFPDPTKFKPERFKTLKSSKNYNPFAYIPFSAGPRNCIGQRFAMLELKCVISKFLRHYEVEVVDKCQPLLVAELILKTEKPLKFRIKPRIYF